MKTFEQIETTKQNPSERGWYDTDKGLLYFHKNLYGSSWSCREDSVSLEYPRFWYKEVKEVIPDLSGATQEQKHLIIKELVETTAKAVLTTFIALGLKTHIETKVTNDATGESYILKFNKIEN